jgi:cysteine desulfuration protein SufE
MNIEQRTQKLISDFTAHQNWEDRYKTLIDLGKTLPAMPEEYKVEDNKVKGCQSQVWLFASLDHDKILFYADSDAAIAKGIVALLVEVYSKSTPTEILSFSDAFLDEIGLKQHLSMSRANGLASMLKQIKLYALAFQAKLNQ